MLLREKKDSNNISIYLHSKPPHPLLFLSFRDFVWQPHFQNPFFLPKCHQILHNNALRCFLLTTTFLLDITLWSSPHISPLFSTFPHKQHLAYIVIIIATFFFSLAKKKKKISFLLISLRYHYPLRKKKHTHSYLRIFCHAFTNHYLTISSLGRSCKLYMRIVFL